MSERPGPYTITTRVDGKTTEFCKPISDPFVTHTVHIQCQWFRWLPWPRCKHKVEVLIGADKITLKRFFSHV